MIQVVEELTGIERSDLEKHEVAIERGLATFTEVGAALMDIHNRRLYRASYSTFEDYCKERWEMTKIHAYRLIGAVRVTQNLRSNQLVTRFPMTESQVRPLTSLEPHQQQEVWQQAVATAPEGVVTAKHVEKTIVEWKSDNRTRLDERGAKKIDDLDDERALTPDTDSADIVTVRVARVIYLMMEDEKVRRNPELWFDLEKIAEIANITPNGAWRMMVKVIADHKVPVVDMDGKYGIPPRNWDY